MSTLHEKSGMGATIGDAAFNRIKMGHVHKQTEGIFVWN